MGGPSAAIVLHELIALGVRRAIRVGTCGALDGIWSSATWWWRGGDRRRRHESRRSGRASGSPPTGSSRRRCCARGRARARDAGPVVSIDLFYDPR